MNTNKCIRVVLFGARESACGRAREARRALTLTLARARENPTPEMEGSSTGDDSSMSTDSRDVSLYAQRLSSG